MENSPVDLGTKINASPLSGKFAEKFAVKLAECKATANSIFDGQKDVGKNIKLDTERHASPLQKQGLFSKIKGAASKAWNGIKDVFHGVWNGIASICENVVNGIVDALNKLSFDVPDWVPLVGGNHFGFSLSRVSIPRLATGTVIPPSAGEFAAILGDNNTDTEVVSPLETMKEAMLEALQESGGNQKQIVLRFDGNLAELARILRPELEQEDRRAGVQLVVEG